MLKTRLQIASLQLLQGVLVLNLLLLQTASDIQELARFSTNSPSASSFRGLRLLPCLLASSPRSSSSHGLSIIPIGYFNPNIYDARDRISQKFDLLGMVYPPILVSRYLDRGGLFIGHLAFPCLIY